MERMLIIMLSIVSDAFMFGAKAMLNAVAALGHLLAKLMGHRAQACNILNILQEETAASSPLRISA